MVKYGNTAACDRRGRNTNFKVSSEYKSVPSYAITPLDPEVLRMIYMRMERCEFSVLDDIHCVSTRERKDTHLSSLVHAQSKETVFFDFLLDITEKGHPTFHGWMGPLCAY